MRTFGFLKPDRKLDFAGQQAAWGTSLNHVALRLTVLCLLSAKITSLLTLLG